MVQPRTTYSQAESIAKTYVGEENLRKVECKRKRGSPRKEWRETASVVPGVTWGGPDGDITDLTVRRV